jgi:hypothetical protein
MWVMTAGTVLFGVGFGALDTALNAHAARHFGARDINWMHALVLAALGGVLVLARPRWRAPASVFPLFTLTTGTTRMVSLQVAASAVGGAALPAGLGLLIGAAGAGVLAPSLLVLGLAMAGLYAFIRRG